MEAGLQRKLIVGWLKNFCTLFIPHGSGVIKGVEYAAENGKDKKSVAK